MSDRIHNCPDCGAAIESTVMLRRPDKSALQPDIDYAPLIAAALELVKSSKELTEAVAKAIP